ncbi:MAG: uroporphyrinogen-III synthase, partial [Curvibacter sp.]
PEVQAALAPLVHQGTWLRVAAERAVSRAMGASCSMPLAAYATLDSGTLSLQAAWGDPHGHVPLVRAQGSAAAADLAAAEALSPQVRSRVTGRTAVLIVRGADPQGLSSEGAGRDWFAQQLRQPGAGVECLASYQRQRPEPTAAALQRARAAASDGSVWVFSSSEAVHNLQFVLPAQDWAAAVAVATHARIAAAVRAAGFGQVRASRPSLPNVLASIESVA